MFRAASVILARKWKQPNKPSTDGQINKTWSIHTTEYCSPIKRNKVPIHATTWTDPENTMLSETRQAQKANTLEDSIHLQYVEQANS